jgi:hypothetical protein
VLVVVAFVVPIVVAILVLVKGILAQRRALQSPLPRHQGAEGGGGGERGETPDSHKSGSSCQP